MVRDGRPVRVEEVSLDPPRRDEVRVRIAAAGVCHSDLSVATGVIPAALPLVLGHEGAGVVEEVGEGVAHLRPGDTVVLAWVAPCGRCFFCRMGSPQLCELGARLNDTSRMPDGSTRVHQDGLDLNVSSAPWPSRWWSGPTPRSRSPPTHRWSGAPCWVAPWPPGWARSSTPPG